MANLTQRMDAVEQNMQQVHTVSMQTSEKLDALIDHITRPHVSAPPPTAQVETPGRSVQQQAVVPEKTDETGEKTGKGKDKKESFRIQPPECLEPSVRIDENGTGLWIWCPFRLDQMGRSSSGDSLIPGETRGQVVIDGRSVRVSAALYVRNPSPPSGKKRSERNIVTAPDA